MKYLKYVFLLISLIMPLSALAIEDRDTQNPLLEEMQTLDSAFKEIVSAVATGEGDRVYKALESTQGLREKTHHAIESGMIRLPKNQHRIKEFLRLDMKFHTELRLLSKAARKNNQRKMLVLTNKLLEGCVNCHRVFKK